MLNRTRLMTSAAVLAALFSFPVHAQDAKRLTADEVRALYAGNEMTATNTRGQEFTEQYKSDGSFDATSTKTDGTCCIADSGRWSVEGDKFCRQYDNWRGGRKTCGYILKTPDGYATQAGLKMKFKRQ